MARQARGEPDRGRLSQFHAVEHALYLDLADKNSWIGGVVGWVDLTDPGVGEALDQIKHPKLVAFSYQWYVEADADWNVRSHIVRGLRELVKRGLRYDLLVKPRERKYIMPLADAVPDLPLVIDHIAKPSIANRQFDDWPEAMKVSASIPRMRIKISGMVTEATASWKPKDLKPYVDKVLELFGTERVMFGSDWPVCLMASPSYGDVFNPGQICVAGLSETEKARVMAENARRFYGLPMPVT